MQRLAALIQGCKKAPDQPVDVEWGMVTDAEISLSGPTATLKKGATNLTLEIRTPRHAVFDTVPTRPFAEEADREGWEIRLPIST